MCDPATGKFVVDSEMVTQFSKRADFPIDRVNGHSFGIVSLLFESCPSAIIWFVISFFVWPSVKSRAWRSFSHVFKEVLKCFPSFTHRNAFAAVIIPRFSFGISATLNHARPTVISWREMFFERMTMGCKSSLGIFSVKASAGLGFSGYQKLIDNCNSFSAFAFANGCKAIAIGVAFWKSVRDYFKSSKSLSDERDFSRHNVSFGHVVFSNGRPATTGAHCAIIS